MAGLTQRELADKIGVSHVSINQYENGKQNPKKATLKRLEEALEIPLGTLAPSNPFALHSDVDNRIRIMFNNECIGVLDGSSLSLTDTELELLGAFRVLGDDIQVQTQAMIDAMGKLSDDGQEKVIKRAMEWVTELCKIPEYQREQYEELLRQLQRHTIEVRPVQDYSVYGPIERQEVSYSLDDEQPRVAEVLHMVLQNKEKGFWHFFYVPLLDTISQESVNKTLENLLNFGNTLKTSDRFSIVLSDEDVFNRLKKNYDIHLDYKVGDGNNESKFPGYVSLILVDTKTWEISKEIHMEHRVKINRAPDNNQE